MSGLLWPCGHPVPSRARALMSSVEMEAYVHPLEEAQVWGWGGPRAGTPDPLCHVSSGLAFLTVRWGQFSLICLLGLI